MKVIFTLTLFAVFVLLLSCTKKLTPMSSLDATYKLCAYPEEGDLIVYHWKVPLGSGCCSGEGSDGLKETWQPNEGINRVLVNSEKMDAKEIQKLVCKN